eukprot:SAG31_NODE_752_length_12351_cov_14.467516_8_plen_150_part_00
MPKKAAEEEVQDMPETQTMASKTGAKEGELVFGVCHLFASFNDTFIHVTDVSGRETICRVTGGMQVKADRDESSPYAAMIASGQVAERLKVRQIQKQMFFHRSTRSMHSAFAGLFQRSSRQGSVHECGSCCAPCCAPSCMHAPRPAMLT